MTVIFLQICKFWGFATKINEISFKIIEASSKSDKTIISVSSDKKLFYF